MAYTAKDFSHILGLPGFSDQLLQNHFKLYEGYVNNTNKLIEMFKTMDQTSSEFMELKRRFGWEFDGMRLHEYYFGNMTKESEELAADSALAKKIEECFGSVEAWQKEFTATASMRGIGWAILYLDPASGQLVNAWINEHDTGHLAGGVPILILDVFEHAYMLDYGVNRADYINAFYGVIDWEEVTRRFDAVVSA